MQNEFSVQQKTKAYVLLLFSYMTIGAMVLTANTAMSPLIAELKLNDAGGALLVTCLSIGNFTSSLLTGFVAGKIGVQKTLRLSGAIIASAFAVFSFLNAVVPMYAMMLLAGLAWGAINNIVNSTVSAMYPGSTSRLNVGHACYSTAAVLFPLLMGFVLKLGGSWRIPVRVVVLMGVILFALTYIIPLPEVFAGQEEKRAGKRFGFFCESRFWLGTMMFFCYVGVETSACAWLSEWLGRQNEFFAKVPSETMVSLMWLMMTVGRLVFAAAGRNIDRRNLLVMLSAGFLIGMLGVVFLSRNTVLSIVSVAFMGFSMAATYATIVANNTRYVTDANSCGFLYSGGGVGSALVPFAAGLVSDAADLQAGMLSLCAVLCVFLAISLINRGLKDTAEA